MTGAFRPRFRASRTIWRHLDVLTPFNSACCVSSVPEQWLEIIAAVRSYRVRSLNCWTVCNRICEWHTKLNYFCLKISDYVLRMAIRVSCTSPTSFHSKHDIRSLFRRRISRSHVCNKSRLEMLLVFYTPSLGRFVLLSPPSCIARMSVLSPPWWRKSCG
jgi:hypothetical protein